MAKSRYGGKVLANDKSSEAIGASELHGSAGHMIRRVHQRAVAIFDEEVDGRLSPRQYAALYTLCLEPGLQQVDLIERIAADRSTVSDLVSRLEKRGLLRRERMERDQRKAKLYATEKGVRIVEEVSPHSDRVHARIMSLLPKRLHAPFLEALAHIGDAD